MSGCLRSLYTYDDILTYYNRYEGLGGEYTLGANMAAGAFAGIAVRLWGHWEKRGHRSSDTGALRGISSRPGQGMVRTSKEEFRRTKLRIFRHGCRYYAQHLEVSTAVSPMLSPPSRGLKVPPLYGVGYRARC